MRLPSDLHYSNFQFQTFPYKFLSLLNYLHYEFTKFNLN